MKNLTPGLRELKHLMNALGSAAVPIVGNAAERGYGNTGFAWPIDNRSWSETAKQLGATA